MGLLRQRVDDGYAAFHAPRYEALLEMLTEHVSSAERVLDIGRSPLTTMVCERFGVSVDTLGFAAEGPTAEGSHYWYDLNQPQDARAWRTDMPRYSVVIMAEVIEHLHTAPWLVLGFLRTLMDPNGILVIQTPNAATLHKRMRMLFGRNPFEPIREDSSDPGHFREYTRADSSTSRGEQDSRWLGGVATATSTIATSGMWATRP